MDVGGRMGVDPLEHVDEVDRRIDLGQDAALDQAVGKTRKQRFFRGLRLG